MEVAARQPQVERPLQPRAIAAQVFHELAVERLDLGPVLLQLAAHDLAQARRAQIGSAVQILDERDAVLRPRDENAAERRLTGQDFVAHRLRAVAQVDAGDAELHDCAAGVQGQQDFASVEIADEPAFQDAHVHFIAVVRFLRHGHVPFVDEQFVVRLRSRGSRDVIEGGHVVGGREKGEEGPQVRVGKPGSR